ncbi:NitT/TauT family transport system substrate-binding protein [Spinactinospora alkalitolerans]|uniref:NitT/TauT family transport system substrate-binding protein n=1 Tax=Spinactinospora alkalitolerans TaxID=687207 RepID=A0A852TP98_9ACTN|nr:ABC transporter substrate-binding protein [Spinactinospora alkalitolerans]NYE45435.1 NitT/TauT family transport system substrate-binding protein [Spinactinospora alkalitolerans]
MPNSRKSAAFAGSALLLFAAACGSGGESDTDTVNVQLDYQLRGNHGMFYVAQELGYFEDERIEIEEITLGSGSPDALRIIGSGRADFGFADLPSLVTARSQGVPVQALAAVNQISPLGMCSLSDNVELDSAEDLLGLTVGVHPGGSTYIFYEALAAANGLDRDRIEEVTVTPPYENYLIEKQVDSVVCYIDAEVPLLEDAAGGEGSLSILQGADVGYDAYGSGLVTNDEVIEEDGDLVQRFTNAYLRAFEYVAENPEETARILAESAPEQADNADLFERQLQADIDHSFTSDVTEENGLGAMDEEMWNSTIDILAEQGVLEGGPISADDVHDPTFTDSYHAEN